MMQLLNALLILFLVGFFVTRDERPPARRPRAMDDETWP